ncbi:glycosyltransferase family 2 protein [bacterium]|nr:glycosyltransferase family 2 protein [bacterium]
MISLAMIVKNEEGRIRRAIGSVKGSVGEVVVVDTGSTDGTVPAAEELGARVIRHPFQGDFSEARNASLAACRGDWVLVLDADEFFPLSPRLMLEAATSIPAAVSGSYKGYYLLRHNYEAGPNEVTYSDHALRLFRRDDRVRYRHRVHETVEESLDELPGVYAELTALPLSHYMFERGAAHQDQKHEKYIEWLQQDISENPGDAGRYDFLGCEYFRCGRLPEAAAAFQKFAELRPDHEGARESLELVRRMLMET